MLRLIRTISGDSRGTAMIEFGFLAPALFAIVLGIVEVGRMFYVRQSLEYATQQAARYYMLNPSTSSATVTMELQNAMAGGMGPDISVAYADAASCNGNVSVTCTTITATYTFNSVAAFLKLGNPQLQARAQAVRVQ